MTRKTKKRILVAAGTAFVLALGAGAWTYYQLTYFPDHLVAIEDGVLYRSQQPVGAEWHVLKTRNIRTVVNLRCESEDEPLLAEEKRACREAGVRYVSIPVGYVPLAADVETFLRVVQESPPVLVHCEHGRSRAGQMAGAYRVIVQGWDAERAFEEWVRRGGSRDKRYDLTRKLFLRLAQERQAWRERLSRPATTAPAKKTKQ